MLLKHLGFLALFAAPATALSAPTPRAPTGGWNVNFADAQCLATRDYGSSQEPIQLVLKAPAIGDVIQVAIARKGSLHSPAQTSATVAVDDRAPFRVSMLVFSPSGSGLRINSMNMLAAEFALVRQARILSVRSDGLDERFSLSDMTPLLKIVDDCVADLRRVFNVTATAAGRTLSLKAHATANLASLFNDYDYPGIALENDQSGIVKFALLINEDGRVADCTIIETSGVAALDTQACALVRLRARFRPAADADGRPAKDAVRASIRWRMD
jgi:TonB family protein